MSRIGVKICGINEPAALDAAAEGGADWIGFVFFSRSPRAVDAATAAGLAARLDGMEAPHRPLRVGLFVRPAPDEVARVLDRVPLDLLQLYTDPDEARALRDRFGLPVWLAHGVREAADLPLRTAFEGLVIESRPPDGAGRPGGNGTRFDWSVTRDWMAPAPWLLAGGLDADNVQDAIMASGAGAVDVSSGVERAPGCKDPALVRRFIERARRAS